MGAEEAERAVHPALFLFQSPQSLIGRTRAPRGIEAQATRGSNWYARLPKAFVEGAPSGPSRYYHLPVGPLPLPFSLHKQWTCCVEEGTSRLPGERGRRGKRKTRADAWRRSRGSKHAPAKQRGRQAKQSKTMRKRERCEFENEWMPVLGGKMATSHGLETDQKRKHEAGQHTSVTTCSGV